MAQTKLVEYNNKYAQAVADMWNESEESWGGYDRLKTKEDIIEEEEISGNINVLLALDDKKVVGYCSFSEYKEEKNVAYIPMLNVAPNYQGKKIGKSLVLGAVKKAIEEDWNRIDLYTWAGNVQAIPLYKKCGFFWEKRDDITHLMNFMPIVLNTEVLKKYFRSIDWYEDSIRNIEIVTDGRKENGFEFFEYMWEKDSNKLKVEFCKKGRGLRLIETEDYKISIIAEDNELVTDNKYNITYHIVNKSGKDLNIDIEGFNDKNIEFKFKKSINVHNEEFIYGEFYLGNIDEEINPFITHPCVSSKVKINGEESIFKLGITPRKPIKLNLVIPQKLIHLGVESIGYLDMENRFNENIKLNILMEDSEDIAFVNKKIIVDMKPKEKTSIEINYILKKYHYFSKDVTVQISKVNNVLESKINLSAIFKGNNGIFNGETKKSWNIINGKYSVELQKLNNEIIIDNLELIPLEKVRILSPRLGLPLSSEFSKKNPENIEYVKEDESILLKALYVSSDFPSIELESITKLQSSGVVEHYYNIFNVSDDETENDIYISESFIFNLGNAYIPFDDNVVSVKGYYGTNLDYWNTKRISENWLFSEDKNITYGISWPDECRIKFNEWYMSIDNNLGKIKGKTCITTKPIVLAYGVYNNWQGFRKFVLKKYQLKEMISKDHLHLSINDENPFVKDELKASIVDYKSSAFNGKLSLKSYNESFKTIEKIYKSEDEIREETFNVKVNSKKLIDMVELNLDFEAVEIKRKRCIFNVGNNKVKNEIVNENGVDTYTVDNGNLTMKVAPKFSNSLYSLVYKGNEWLDSDFPKIGTRSWWSPWTGGILCSPGEPNALQNTDVFEGLDEERKAEFIEISDNHNNVWSGIKLNIKIKENEKYKGLEINQYFLTMPQIPMVCYTAEIIQNSGKYLNNTDFVTTMFIKSDENLKDSYFISKNNYGDEVKYKAGAVQMCTYDNELMMYGGNNRKDKLEIYSPKALSVDGYLDIKMNGCFIRNKVRLANSNRVFLPLTFMMFTEEYIDENLLSVLKGIKLDK
ncbi:GNAT family N-acetyltransferase [Oceanirhabdus seepicola]|uniref:GNAT family N-acetyltransferase n=1 Tax=Oceanirhabdus seepicola TaxID=2828781 RepID=A0A9J6NY87_9CLOT|nr:GNAT family N-acetyltransferase [Oceanirhabdus seepicola]MCM1989012.1 GNAT family N-acetyltransferase [Oceanirhabdus seepicola]